MGLPLRGKTVVVTGASSGIGRSAALEFARRGAVLFVAARRPHALDTLAAECHAVGASCAAVVTDVSREEECSRLIEMAGRVDVLVNNAGFGIFDLVENARNDDLEAMMRTNYFGAVHCTRAVLPQMLERRSGTIVNVASIAGIMGYAGMGGYCATKFALIGFTEALRDEVAGRGVRVSLVCPGTTEETEFFTRTDRAKMPAASRLVAPLDADRVGAAVCDAAEDGPYRIILPPAAAAYMKFKEVFPRLAHLLMRRVSALLE